MEIRLGAGAFRALVVIGHGAAEHAGASPELVGNQNLIDQLLGIAA